MSNSPFLNIFSTFWQGLCGHDEPSADMSTPGSPLVNVDGTPMLDSAVDVLGKLYGDCGPSLTDSCGLSGFDPHGTDW
jgi:hypothetical protein